MKLCLSSFNIVMLKMLMERYPGKVNVLRSYGVASNEDWAIMRRKYGNIDILILDCGTFSLHFADSVDDEKVSLKGYIRYVERFGKYFDFYFSFDRNFTVNGFEENKESYLHLKKAGLNPVPVIHDYEGEEIDFYISEGCEYVALGSVMEEGSDKMQRKQSHIDDATWKLHNAGVKVHLFGGSSYGAIAHLPLYSCDSSSWAQNNKYGFILYWNEDKEGENKTDKLYFYDNFGDDCRSDRNYFEDYKDKDKLEKYLTSHKISYQQLMQESTKNRYRPLVNALYYLKIEKIINEKQERNGLLVI